MRGGVFKQKENEGDATVLHKKNSQVRRKRKIQEMGEKGLQK